MMQVMYVVLQDMPHPTPFGPVLARVGQHCGDIYYTEARSIHTAISELSIHIMALVGQHKFIDSASIAAALLYNGGSSTARHANATLPRAHSHRPARTNPTG
jgi:hypothetical protein